VGPKELWCAYRQLAGLQHILAEVGEASAAACALRIGRLPPARVFAAAAAAGIVCPGAGAAGASAVTPRRPISDKGVAAGGGVS